MITAGYHLKLVLLYTFCIILWRNVGSVCARLLNGQIPKRGYQVGMKQLVRPSSITHIPPDHCSWHHQDGATHSLSLSLTLSEKTYIRGVENELMLCMFMFIYVHICVGWLSLIFVFFFFYPFVIRHAPILRDVVNAAICEPVLGELTVKTVYFIIAGPVCLSVTVSSSKPKVEVHEHTGETVQCLKILYLSLKWPQL